MGPQRPLPRGRVAWPPVEDVEPVREAIEEQRQRQVAGAGRGELDGQWQALQAAADRVQQPRLRWPRLEIGAGGALALHEQGDGLAGQHRLPGGIRCGQAQGRYPELVLTIQTQRDAAGGQHA